MEIIEPLIKYINLYSPDYTKPTYTDIIIKVNDVDTEIIHYCEVDNITFNKKLDWIYNTLDNLISFGDTIGIDTETTGLKFLDSKCLLVSITIKGITYVVNVYDWTKKNNYILAKFTEMLFKLDQKYYPIWVGHNLTFDLRFMYNAYYKLTNTIKQFEFVYCTLIAELKLFQGLEKSDTLSSLYSLRLGVDMSKAIRETFHSKETREKIKLYNRFDASNDQLEYASIDTIGLKRLMELQISNMEEMGMNSHVLNIEMAVINPITEAEILGLRHDTESWIRVAEEKELEANEAVVNIENALKSFTYNEEEINPKYFLELDNYTRQIEKTKDRIDKLEDSIAKTENTATKKFTNFEASLDKARDALIVYENKLEQHKLEPVISWSSPKQVVQTMIQIGMEETDQMITIKDGRETKNSTGSDARSQWMINNKSSKYYNFVEAFDKYKNILSLIQKYGTKWAEKFVREERVHTEFRQMGTVTGRLASGKSKLGLPNMQQIPREVAYRQCFISDLNKLFMTIDWSSAELCLIIGVSEDKNLLKAFKEGGDAHGYVATICWRKIYAYRASIENDPIKKKELEHLSQTLIVSKKENGDLRTKFKNVHFGILYGAHITKIAQTMEINTIEASIVVAAVQEFEDSAFNFLQKSAEATMLNGYTVCHPAINTIKYSPPAVEYLYSMGYLTKEGKKYLKELQTNPKLLSQKNKFITDMMNTIRKKDFMKALELDTKTRNLPIQSSQAEALKIYLANYKVMKRKYHLDNLEFNLTVHDEVVHQFPEYYQYFVPNIIYNTMCEAPTPFLNGILDIEAEYHIGTSWEK